jgi:hypothetical protein
VEHLAEILSCLDAGPASAETLALFLGLDRSAVERELRQQAALADPRVFGHTSRLWSLSDSGRWGLEAERLALQILRRLREGERRSFFELVRELGAEREAVARAYTMCDGEGWIVRASPSPAHDAYMTITPAGIRAHDRLAAAPPSAVPR